MTDVDRCVSDRCVVVIVLLQEKGVPLMGESSFLASWVNRATMMGTYMKSNMSGQ